MYLVTEAFRQSTMVTGGKMSPSTSSRIFTDTCVCLFVSFFPIDRNVSIYINLVNIMLECEFCTIETEVAAFLNICVPV